MNAANLKKLIIQEIENYNRDQYSLKTKDVKILLYNYNKYLGRIKLYTDELNELELNPLIINKVSDDIKVQKSSVFKSELEKIEDKKEMIKAKINKLIHITTKIKEALCIIQEEEYYIIIIMKYFQKKTNKEICNKLYISESTLIRHHNSLIKELKSILFL